MKEEDECVADSSLTQLEAHDTHTDVVTNVYLSLSPFLDDEDGGKKSKK